MRTFILCVLLTAIFGCNNTVSLEVEPWDPTEEQLSLAEEIARKYALTELGLKEENLNHMKIQSRSWCIEGQEVVTFQFYDPEHFPDWENMAGVMGGFPYYFTITVDTNKGVVIKHYASTQ